MAHGRDRLFFAFHHINAYEHEGKVVVDVCAHKDARVTTLYLKKIRSGSKVPQAGIAGSRSGSKVREDEPARPDRRLHRAAAEELRPGQRRHYRYAYGRSAQGIERFIDQPVKAVKKGESKLWREWVYPGERYSCRGPEGRSRTTG